MRYEFRLQGLTPLIMHRDNVEAADALDEWRKNPENKGISKAGDDRSPPWTWQTSLYSDDKGFITIPSDNLMVALRFAGARLPMKRQESFKATTQSGLLMLDEFLAFRWDGRKAALNLSELERLHNLPFTEQATIVRDEFGFRLFVKRAKIKTNKHVRVRPRFDAWTATGEVEVTEQAITRDVLTQLFNIAGNRAGLCDWRPSSVAAGSFGRFTSILRQIN